MNLNLTFWVVNTYLTGNCKWVGQEAFRCSASAVRFKTGVERMGMRAVIEERKTGILHNTSDVESMVVEYRKFK
jgi:hypothetical protein